MKKDDRRPFTFGLPQPGDLMIWSAGGIELVLSTQRLVRPDRLLLRSLYYSAIGREVMYDETHFAIVKTAAGEEISGAFHIKDIIKGKGQ